MCRTQQESVDGNDAKNSFRDCQILNPHCFFSKHAYQINTNNYTQKIHKLYIYTRYTFYDLYNFNLVVEYYFYIHTLNAAVNIS